MSLHDLNVDQANTVHFFTIWRLDIFEERQGKNYQNILCARSKNCDSFNIYLPSSVSYFISHTFMKMKIKSFVFLPFILLRIKVSSSTNLEMFEFGIFENFKRNKELLLHENSLLGMIQDEKGMPDLLIIFRW